MLTRALIVLLLVLNLGVAAWWWLRPSPVDRVAPVQPSEVPRLRLVGEAGARPAPARAPAASPVRQPSAPPAAASVVESDAPAQAPPRRCFALGPFTDRAAAETARDALPAGAGSARLRTEAVPARGGSWDVRVPPQPDRAAAQAMAQRIEAAGFRDYYVIGEGASANGIALGRFGSEDSARRHQAALQAAGFAAQVQGPPPAGSRTWVDFAANASFDATTMTGGTGASRLQSTDCPAPAQAPSP